MTNCGRWCLQEGFSDLEKTTFKHVIRRNVVEVRACDHHRLAKVSLGWQAMQTLIAGAEKFGYKFKNPVRAATALHSGA